jgi:antitoxin (DNA-binding transcriptional repressor) of toxin-antitoxin stability system
MISATLQEAKAKLNKLVALAQKGESVVLMRGSKVVATIVPIGEEAMEVSTHLSDAQAERLWTEIDSNSTKKFKSAEEAISFLKKRS